MVPPMSAAASGSSTGRAALATALSASLATALLSALFAAGAEAAEEPALFGFGRQEIGFSLGYGDGASITSSGRVEGRLVQELVLLGHWQIALSREPLRPAWYKGMLSLRIEPHVIVNFEPRTGVAGGAAAMLRYEWTRFDTRPFVEGGAGIIGLDFDVFDQADGLAFDPTLGAGVIHRFDDHWSLQLALRFQHISNAFTEYPNGGIEAFQYLLGGAYRF